MPSHHYHRLLTSRNLFVYSFIASSSLSEVLNSASISFPFSEVIVITDQYFMFLFPTLIQKRKKSPEFILLQGNMPLAASPASLVSLLASLSDRTWGLGLTLQGAYCHFTFITSFDPSLHRENRIEESLH
jgi:hypothetical protein